MSMQDLYLSGISYLHDAKDSGMYRSTWRVYFSTAATVRQSY